MQDVKQLLVIRPGAIGDTLLTMPLLQTMRRNCPGLSIHFVGNAVVLPLLHAYGLVEHSSNYDDVQWSYLFMPSPSSSQRQSRGYKQFRRTLEQCDTVIAWLRDDMGVVADNLREQGISRAIIAAGRPAESQREHITDYLAHTLGPRWYDWSAQASWQAPEGYNWQPLPSTHERTTIAIHPGSGGAHKCWPVAAFAQLIHMLWQKGIAVLLLVGPADEERVRQLQILLRQPPTPSFLRLVLSAPLLHITQELQQCHAYIGNDSGITHLAALLGVPTVALFGPSDAVTWRPIGARVTLLQQPVLEKLSPQVVYENIGLG